MVYLTAVRVVLLLLVMVTFVQTNNENREKDPHKLEYTQTRDKMKGEDRELKHIVFFHNVGTGSHLQGIRAMAQGLLQKGHKVTTILYQPLRITHAHYKEILIEDMYEKIIQERGAVMLKEGKNIFSWRLWRTSISLWNSFFEHCADIYDHPDVLNLMDNTETIDVVITLQGCASYLAYISNSSIIQWSPPGPFAPYLTYLGNPFNPSYQPFMSFPGAEPMSFFHRMGNTGLYLVINWLMEYFDNSF